MDFQIYALKRFYTSHLFRGILLLGHGHRAHLMKQETSITVYRLLTKENKLPFSVCRKQTEVCCPLFSFAANKQKLPLSVSSVFHRHKILDFLIQYPM
jgi:hypothetical protein